MWDNRCKIAVSGVGYSKATRTAERPLAAHALEAVKAAVADSGLKLADIDGLATYPELPATGHAEVDGISIVSVNCMMAMLKLPEPHLAHPGRLGEHRRRGAAGGERAARGRVQVRRRLARDAQPERHVPEPARRSTRAGAPQFTGPYGFGGPGQGHGGRLHALSREEQPDAATRWSRSR